MTSTQQQLVEAIREAIARSHADDGLPADVDIPATEAEFIEAVRAVWPHDWQYVPSDVDIGHDVVPVWLAYGWTEDTPRDEYAWRVMVQRAYAREVLAAHARRFAD